MQALRTQEQQPFCMPAGCGCRLSTHALNNAWRFNAMHGSKASTGTACSHSMRSPQPFFDFSCAANMRSFLVPVYAAAPPPSFWHCRRTVHRQAVTRRICWATSKSEHEQRQVVECRLYRAERVVMMESDPPLLMLAMAQWMPCECRSEGYSGGYVLGQFRLLMVEVVAR